MHDVSSRVIAFLATVLGLTSAVSTASAQVRLRFESPTPGVRVYAGATPERHRSCLPPCTLELEPGPTVLWVSRGAGAPRRTLELDEATNAFASIEWRDGNDYHLHALGWLVASVVLAALAFVPFAVTSELGAYGPFVGGFAVGSTLCFAFSLHLIMRYRVERASIELRPSY